MLKSWPSPRVILDKSGKTVCKFVVALPSWVAKLPSNLKYVLVPPEPSSDLKDMSLSLVLFCIIKSPVLFDKYVSVLSWFIWKSWLVPTVILDLSGQFVYNPVVAEPSWVAEEPLR